MLPRKQKAEIIHTTDILLRVPDDDLYDLPPVGHVLHLHQPCPVWLPQPEPADGDEQVCQGLQGVAGLGDNQDCGDHCQDSDKRRE